MLEYYDIDVQRHTILYVHLIKLNQKYEQKLAATKNVSTYSI